MDIHLSPEMVRLIEERVSTGRYDTAGEVVMEALGLLLQRDEAREARLEALRREIDIGLEQARRGELIEADEVFGRLMERNAAAIERER